MKKIMIFVLALALVIEPQMVKASKYVGKEVNINDYLKNTDDVLYSKLYIDKDYTGELPDGDSIDSHLKYLDKVTVAEDNPKYKSIDGVVYSKDGKQLLLYPAAKNEEGTFEVPKEVTEIGKYAFNDAKISHITLNDNIDSIRVHKIPFFLHWEGISASLGDKIRKPKFRYWSDIKVLYNCVVSKL